MNTPGLLHCRTVGAGSPVLFIHGMGASGRYWGSRFDALGDTHRLAFVDLAGFGRSRRLPGPYGIDAQVQQLRMLVDENVPDTPLVLVGHSFGAVIAFAAAARWPDVSTVVGFGIPAFGSPEEAQRRLAGLGVMERLMAAGSPWAERACWTLCRLRFLARFAAPLIAPDLPRDVARDGVEHTWASASQAFDSMVHDADLVGWSRTASARLVVVQGDHDPVCPPWLVERVLAHTGVEVRTVPGDHHLPLRQPGRCLLTLQGLIDPA